MQLLGPLIDFKVVRDGDTVESLASIDIALISPPRDTNNSVSMSISHRSASNFTRRSVISAVNLPKCHRFQAMTLLFQGLCINLNPEVTIESFRNNKHTPKRQEPVLGHTASRGSVNILQRSASFIEVMKRFNPLNKSRISPAGYSYEESGMLLEEGSIFGLEHYFLQKPIHNIIVSEE